MCPYEAPVASHPIPIFETETQKALNYYRPYKKCPTCNQIKSLDDFYVSKKKNKSGNIHPKPSTYCISCTNNKRNERRNMSNITSISRFRSSGVPLSRKTKRCNRCGEIKEAKEFYVIKIENDCLKLTPYCKPCHLSYDQKLKKNRKKIYYTKPDEPNLFKLLTKKELKFCDEYLECAQSLLTNLLLTIRQSKQDKIDLTRIPGFRIFLEEFRALQEQMDNLKRAFTGI